MHHAHIDKFSFKDSPIHRLDSRVKFLVVLIFTAIALSLPRTSPGILVYYAIGPFTILVLGRVPLKFAFKQILIVSPFILVLALSCPFYDRNTVSTAFGPFVWQISTGWLRCFSILGKFIVTMMALIALVSTTRFADLLTALQKLTVPRQLIIQLGFLYRYIFVLIDRAHQILRARSGRKLQSLGFKAELKTASSMLGSLFIRSIDTAEHINIAMQARGFNGNWRSLSRLRFRRCDLFFILAFSAFMLVMYFIKAKVMR